MKTESVPEKKLDTDPPYSSVKRKILFRYKGMKFVYNPSFLREHFSYLESCIHANISSKLEFIDSDLN